MWLRYGAALVALATGLRGLLHPVLRDEYPFAAHYLAVMFAAWYGGLAPGLLAAVASLAAAAYLFADPGSSSWLADPQHLLGGGLFVLVSSALTWLLTAVQSAQDGQQAIALLREREIDVVLMDLQMPVMDGFQATAAIRALDDRAKSGVPIIALTAHALKGDAERCLAAGMDGYLAKPIDQRELVELVERLAACRAGRAAVA